MMESETPPTSPPHEVGDTEVSSQRSPDLSEHLAPTGGDEKGPAQFGVRPNVLAGLLERVALLEEHRSLMSMVLTKFHPLSAV